MTLNGFIGAVGEAHLDPPNWPPFYTMLAQDKAQYAIMELPLFSEQGRGEDTYEAYQTIHGKARLGGRLARDHKLTNPNNFTRQMSFFRDFYWLGRSNEAIELLRPTKTGDILTPPDYSKWGGRLLNYYNIRYLVLYLDAYKEQGHKTIQQAQSMIKQALGPGSKPVYTDNQMIVYQVPVVESSGASDSNLFVDISSTGWYGVEKDSSGRLFRWANLDNSKVTSLIVFNGSRLSRSSTLEFKAFAYKQPVDINPGFEGQALNSIHLQPDQLQDYKITLSVPPGLHFLNLTALQSPLAVGNPADNRSLSFALSEVRLTEDVLTGQ